MGKASRRKHAAEQQRRFFDIKGDARSAEDRARARATLDALQQKLEDDALREDGFYFVNDKYVEARRPRVTPGMKTQSYTGHKRRISHVTLVPMPVEGDDSPDLNSFLVTFATDWIGVWDMTTGERLGSLDLATKSAASVCGAATRLATNQSLWIAYATHLKPYVLTFDTTNARFHHLDINDAPCTFSIGHQQQITCIAFSNTEDKLLATGSLDSTCILWDVKGDDKLFLTMLTIIPVADAGVTSCCFTDDDQEIVIVGADGTVKTCLVDCDGVRAECTQSERQQWEDALPLSLSVPNTLNLLVFDAMPPGFHSNDEWLVHANRTILGKVDSLRVLSSEQSSDDAMQQAYMDQMAHTTEIGECIPNDSTEIGETSSENESAGVIDDEIERLRSLYEKMETFDFQRMLDPEGPLLRVDEHGEQNIKSIKWPLISPESSGRLVKTFSSRKKNGDFASHTSVVSGTAVAKGADLVVTVSHDKSVICWSLTEGIVRSILREAHAAPITCCATTSFTTCSLELRIATAAMDNVVKVWRLKLPEADDLESVYSLVGHFDGITSLSFDASGVFLVSAGEDALAHCWRIRPAPPNSPLKPTVLVIDRFAITIQWNVPLANGSALLKYVIRTEQLTSLRDDKSDMKHVADVEVGAKYKNIMIDNLQPGIQYTLRVAAVNQVGQSRWSEPTDPIETLAFAPSKINKAVQYRDVTSSTIRLSWCSPCANGAKITGYTVKALPENSIYAPTMTVFVDVDELSVAEAEPPLPRRRQVAKGQTGKTHAKLSDTQIYEYVLQGLWPGEVYQFIVAAENRCGVGDFSPFSDYVRMESTAPDAPGQPVITSVRTRDARVEWIKPRSNGSEILQYIIEWTQHEQNADRQSVTVLTKSILGTSYTITGLKPGRALRVWIAATNLVYGKLSMSPFSDPSEDAWTLCDVPDQPPKPRVESLSSHSVLVVVFVPCDNGSPIESYDLTLSIEEIQFGILTKRVAREFQLRPDEFDSTYDSPQHSQRYTIPKLRAMSFYSATVVARNALGSSKASENSVAVATKAATVPATISDQPSITCIEPNQATISWSRPDHDGGTPIISFVLQFSIDGGPFNNEIVLFSGSQLVLEHLKPKTTYAFRVAASNAVGRADFSPACEPFTTPSLVEFTITSYFANRPPIEHAKATVIQRRYRQQKRRKREQREYLAQLSHVLATSWHLL